MGGGFLACLQIDYLCVGRLLCIPEIHGDDVAHPGDLGEFVADIGNRKIKVLRADKEDIVCRPLPDGFEQTGHQLNQAAGLLELLIFLEECDDVLEPWMEGIGGGDLIGNRFGATACGFGFGCLFQLAAKGFGDVSDFGFVGKRLEQSLAQDVINLVGGKVNRRNVALCAAKLLTCVVERSGDQGAAGLICRIKIGDHYANIGLLARGC